MNDYTYKLDGKRFIIYQHGEEVYRSRKFRLEVQADRKARDYIKALVGHEPDNVILNVENLSIDPDSLFGGKTNG